MLGEDIPEVLRDVDVVMMRLVGLARNCDDLLLDEIIRRVDMTLGKLVYIQWRNRPHERVKGSNDDKSC